jgi:hypothetical protein
LSSLAEEDEMSIVTNQEIAEQWVDGLTREWSVLETLSSPTMRVWHSHDNVWLDRADAAARMQQSGERTASPRFEDVRAIPTEKGFIVQGSIQGLAGNGRTHIVQILTVEDGKIAACEEYIAPEMNLDS